VRKCRGIVDVGDRELQLLRKVGDALDDLAERVLDVAGQRIELRRGLDHVRKLGDPGHQVRLLGDVLVDPDPLGALDEDAHRPVGHLEHASDDAGHPDVVELVGPGLVGLRVAGGDHGEDPFPGEHVVDQLDGARLTDREWGQRVGERDRGLERQDRKRLWKRLALALANRLLEIGRLDHLDPRSGADLLVAADLRPNLCLAGGVAFHPVYSSERRTGRRRDSSRCSISGSSTRRIPSS
jgi:hypothetical protein